MENKEPICYFCKYAYHAGTDMIYWTCKLTGKKVESSDYCYNFEDFEE